MRSASFNHFTFCLRRSGEVMGKRSMHFRVLTLICLTATILASGIADGGEIDLTPRHRRDQLVRVSSVYEVAGSLTVAGSDKPTKAPLIVSSTSKYEERMLTSEFPSSTGKNRDRPRRRSVRYYSPFQAKLVINGEEIRPELRAERSLIAVSLDNSGLTMHSPSGPLTREELDLVQWPGDSLASDALLPRQAVSVGDKWEVDETLLGALLNISSVGQSAVTAELMEANGDFARIEAAGVVHGTVDGTATTIDIKSRCYFDLRNRIVQSVQLVLNEKRKIGEVTPGVEAVSKIKVKFTPINRSADLSDRALVSIDLEANTDSIRLDFTPVSSDYRLQHDRDWHVTRDDRKAAILRQIENGDVLCQCNISSLPQIGKGKQVTLNIFRDDVQKTLGKNFGQFVNVGEFVDERGRLVYHVEAVGKVADVPIRWRYYLAAKTDGRRVALVFTMDEEMVERFGAADRRLLAGLELLATATKAPTPSSPEAQALRDVPKPADTDQNIGSRRDAPRRVGRGDDRARQR
jgi:hypothetical protein